MSDICALVRGAWHTGAELEAVADAVRAAGHTVHCPTLARNRPGDSRVAARVLPRLKRPVYERLRATQWREPQRPGAAVLRRDVLCSSGRKQRRRDAALRDLARGLHQRRRHRARHIGLRKAQPASVQDLHRRSHPAATAGRAAGRQVLPQLPAGRGVAAEHGLATAPVGAVGVVSVGRMPWQS